MSFCTNISQLYMIFFLQLVNLMCYYINYQIYILSNVDPVNLYLSCPFVDLVGPLGGILLGILTS